MWLCSVLFSCHCLHQVFIQVVEYCTCLYQGHIIITSFLVFNHDVRVRYKRSVQTEVLGHLNGFQGSKTAEYINKTCLCDVDSGWLFLRIHYAGHLCISFLRIACYVINFCFGKWKESISVNHPRQIYGFCLLSPHR